MKQLKVLELFAGLRSIGKAFEEKGHKVVSVEWNEDFKDIDEYVDVSTLTAEYLIGKYGYFDVVWASPDCTSYSVAGISHHRRKNKETGELEPISEYAKFCDKVNIHMIELIKELKPIAFFIENPMGGMRKMKFVEDIPRNTTSYCQYGDTRQKKTDIFSNIDPKLKPACKNGSPCHVAAPRGSRTGTQGLKGSIERSKIPPLLCQHIVDVCEDVILS